MFSRLFRALLLPVFALGLSLSAGELSAAAANPAQGNSTSSSTPSQQQSQGAQDSGDYSIAVTVPVVTVDVVVTDNDGNYLKGLTKENFRLTDDGAVQSINSFAPTDAPITVVLLLEDSARGGGWFAYNSAVWASQFLRNLKPSDWVALVTFSMRPEIEVDFTHSPQQILAGLQSMVFPVFHEANLFDAIADTNDRLKDAKGKKAILVLAQGIDTFSKLTFDGITKKLRDTDVTLFAVGVGEAQFEINDSLASPNEPNARMDYLQAQNEVRSLTAETGGRAWFPRLEGEIGGIMNDVASSLRNQYSLTYTPTNSAADGKYHKIKVELVAPDGSPYTITDQKGKKVKFQVYARQGYTAPKPAAAN